MPEIISRKEALKKGLKRYFTGEPCKYGHIDERGVNSGCITCGRERERRPDIRKKRMAYQKDYYQTEKGKYIASQSQKKYRDKPDVKKRKKEYFENYVKTEKGIESQKKAQKKYREKEEVKEHKKKYHDVYYNSSKGKEVVKKSQKKYQQKKLSTPEGKLETQMRRYIHHALTKVNLKKEEKLINLIGCNIKQLKKHLEKHFTKGMSWENWGRADKKIKTWHIDHIIPIDYFKKNYDYTDIKIQKKCWNYKNLRPMWANENITKSNKIINV